MRYRPATVALRTSLIYGLVAAVWLLLSDQALNALLADTSAIGRLQPYRGWAFVAITSALLYGVLRRDLRHWEQELDERERAATALRQSEARFAKALEFLRRG